MVFSLGRSVGSSSNGRSFISTVRPHRRSRLERLHSVTWPTSSHQFLTAFGMVATSMIPLKEVCWRSFVRLTVTISILLMVWVHVVPIFILNWNLSLPAEPHRKPKNTGVGSLSRLQRNFRTQELNQDLLLRRQILSQLSYQGIFLSLDQILKSIIVVLRKYRY